MELMCRVCPRCAIKVPTLSLLQANHANWKLEPRCVGIDSSCCQRAVIVERVQLSICLEQGVLNDVLTVQDRHGHAGTVRVQAGAEVGNRFKECQVACLEPSKGPGAATLLGISISIFCTRPIAFWKRPETLGDGVGNRRAAIMYFPEDFFGHRPNRNKPPCTNRALLSGIEATRVRFERKADSPNC
jgi:hypothetical protein